MPDKVIVSHYLTNVLVDAYAQKAPVSQPVGVPAEMKECPKASAITQKISELIFSFGWL